ncbi:MULTISPECIES: NmrA family NAD(P)-binding protein [unclassified Anaeromyxobacter]|uniref:NmrA family NAD(P)-binding protein n=1 Tax=unclassified Anaeromyxobacter TaxID=2620896 RepID=UPI001F5ACC49|nr:MULTISPECIES: NmrA family NAD(P)-binding protein [unclassified Anaeromyxobacter]
MKKPRILVTAAAGHTGTPTALQLLERGYPVRCLVRRVDARSERLRDAGAEVVVGSLTDPADVERALEGAQRAYLCPPWGPDLLHVVSTFAVAAREARLESMVALSQWLASPRHPSMATRGLWLMEQTLPWIPEVAVTVVNPGFFADNYMRLLEPIAQLGVMPMPLGAGENAPPSNEDIASVVVGALLDPETHGGKTYRPTGPRLLSPAGIADAFSKALGRRVRYVELPQVMFRKALRVLGLSPFEQSQLRHYVEDYRRNAFAVNAPTDVVASVGGRAPEEFESIARRYATSRPEARRTVLRAAKALWNFTRILLTPPLDLDRVDRVQGHPGLERSELANDSGIWRATHAAMPLAVRVAP